MGKAKESAGSSRKFAEEKQGEDGKNVVEEEI